MSVFHPGRVTYLTVTLARRSRSAEGKDDEDKTSEEVSVRVSFVSPTSAKNGRGGLTREPSNLLPVQLVGNSDLDLLESVENVELGEVEGVVTVDGVRVLEDDEIEPSTTTTSTGGGSVLGSNLLHHLSSGLREGNERRKEGKVSSGLFRFGSFRRVQSFSLPKHLSYSSPPHPPTPPFPARTQPPKKEKPTHIQLLSRERTPTNSRRISLHHTNGLPNLLRRDSQSSADSSDRGRRGGNERVGSVIEIEHESVGSFDEDSLLLG